MTAPHEVVIRLGRPFDIRTNGDAFGGVVTFTTGVREVSVPFADRESAEAALAEMTVTVRQVNDAGGEDYRPVIPGKVLE